MSPHHQRVRHALLCGAFLVAGLILFFGSPHVRLLRILRPHGGDVLVMGCLHYALGVIWPAHRWRRLGAVVVIALIAEFAQLLPIAGPDSPWWVHLTIGSTFDPWDLLAYLLGAVLVALIERRLMFTSS